MWMARATGGCFASAHSFEYLYQTLGGWPDGPCLQPRVEVVRWAPAALVAGQADGRIVNRHVERTIVKNHRGEGPGVAVVAGDQVQRQVAQSPVLGQQVRGGFCQLDREHLVAERAGGLLSIRSFAPPEKFFLSRQKVPTGCL